MIPRRPVVCLGVAQFVSWAVSYHLIGIFYLSLWLGVAALAAAVGLHAMFPAACRTVTPV